VDRTDVSHPPRARRLLARAGILLAAVVAVAGCRGSDEPRLISAEFEDETPDGAALQGESIRVTLDRPLRPEAPLDRIFVSTQPPVDWTWSVERTNDPRVLEVRILSGRPAFRWTGRHGVDPDATGIGLDLGDGRRQWVDLDLAVSNPILERVVWEDRKTPDGDLAVDQGDVLRLLFDRPVRLRAAGEDRRVLVPQDVLLSKPNQDRLDDGEVPATFEPGADEREVRIVLGSRPILTVFGSLPPDAPGIEREKAIAPSSLALNGTAILPMAKVTDARGGNGSVSSRLVDVETPDDLPTPRPRQDQELPAPGSRFLHTLTQLSGGRAVLVGGAESLTRRPLDQVVLYDPFPAEARQEPAFRAVAEKLPHPTQLHTATRLAGPDSIFGTFDDVVAIAGGFDGDRSLDDLTLLVQRDDGSIAVVPLAEKLRIARCEHAAVAVGPNSLLVDGGRKMSPDEPGGLVQCAELLNLAFDDAGAPRVSHHAAFRTLGRASHTLSLLPPAQDGDSFVLAYGGVGRFRSQQQAIEKLGQEVEDGDALVSEEKLAVLASPLLIHLRSPERSFELYWDFNFSFLRWGHVAVPLEPREARGGPPQARSVLIAGGSIRSPSQSPDSEGWLIEMPRDREMPDSRSLVPQRARDSILFRFDPAAPAQSRFEILPAASADSGAAPERLYFGVAIVPERGVLLVGGEVRGGQQLGTMEMFLSDEQRLVELAVPLLAPRSRHQCMVLVRNGKPHLLTVGGVFGSAASDKTDGGEPSHPPAVEELPLR